MATATMNGIPAAAAPEDDLNIEASATWTYAVKDGEELKMDWYSPAPGSETCIEGEPKPLIMFIFGGGFRSGERSEKYYWGYFDAITRMGYSLVTIDYRLGLKGCKAGSGLAYFKTFDQVIHLAVDDLYSAVSYLLEHRQETGLDARNMVLCGSSAGAIIALQSLLELGGGNCPLPRDYSFKAVMSYSGGVISNTGKPAFADRNCPVLLLHGTADKVVEYNKIQFFNLGFFGSSAIAVQLRKALIPYNILRYEGNGHEISALMKATAKLQNDFILDYVVHKKGIFADTLIKDDSIEKWKPFKTSDLYKGDDKPLSEL